MFRSRTHIYLLGYIDLWNAAFRRTWKGVIALILALERESAVNVWIIIGEEESFLRATSVKWRKLHMTDQ